MLKITGNSLNSLSKINLDHSESTGTNVFEIGLTEV